MIVLIPSYEADARLVDMVRELRAAAPDAPVLVVDDGSGSEYAVVFDVVRAAGAEVIGYPANRGKGHALKVGFAHVLDQHPGEAVVCADSDGQHRVADILRVAAELPDAVPVAAGAVPGPARAPFLASAPVAVAGAVPVAGGGAHDGRVAPQTPRGAGGPAASAGAGGDAGVGGGARPGGDAGAVGDAGATMVIGGRRFTGRVPLRSRLGNTVARGTFRLATGLAVGDTQTGLRGYPPEMLPWLLEVKGERFEYELNALLAAGAAGHAIRELPIDTVYLDHNASSHFRPVRDSLRVMRPFLRYAASSLAAFAVDAMLLVLLFAATGSLLLAVIGARLASASVNFVVNRQLVFRARRRRPVARDALRYATLAVVLLGASYGLLDLATGIGMPLLAAKVTTDTLLYVGGFLIQRRFVFKRPPAPVPREHPAISPTGHAAPPTAQEAPRSSVAA